MPSLAGRAGRRDAPPANCVTGVHMSSRHGTSRGRLPRSLAGLAEAELEGSRGAAGNEGCAGQSSADASAIAATRRASLSPPTCVMSSWQSHRTSLEQGRGRRADRSLSLRWRPACTVALLIRATRRPPPASGSSRTAVQVVEGLGRSAGPAGDGSAWQSTMTSMSSDRRPDGRDAAAACRTAVVPSSGSRAVGRPSSSSPEAVFPRHTAQLREPLVLERGSVEFLHAPPPRWQ